MKSRLAFCVLAVALVFAAGGAGIANAHDMGMHYPNNNDRKVFAFSGHSSVACGGVHRRAAVIKMIPNTDANDHIAIAEYRRGSSFIYSLKAYVHNETRLSTCGDSITHLRACEEWTAINKVCTSWHT